MAVLARKASRSNVTINGILPGPFDTDRLRGTTQKMAEARKVAVSVVEAERKASVPAGRFGTAEEFGAVVAFLCSQHAGFITGQNLLIDGGGFPVRSKRACHCHRARKSSLAVDIPPRG